MKFITRLGYYLGGFSVGLILLAVFLGGKKTSCDYGPNSRTIKNIAIKKRQYQPKLIESLNNLDIDTTDIQEFLLTGSVDFSNSAIGKDSCNNYSVENIINEQKFILQIINCDSIAYYISLNKKPD